MNDEEKNVMFDSVKSGLELLEQKEREVREVWPLLGKSLFALREAHKSNKAFNVALAEHDIDIDRNDRAAYIFIGKMLNHSQELYEYSLKYSDSISARYFVDDIKPMMEKRMASVITVSDNRTETAVLPTQTPTIVQNMPKKNVIPNETKTETKTKPEKIDDLTFLTDRYNGSRDGTVGDLKKLYSSYGMSVLLPQLVKLVEAGVIPKQSDGTYIHVKQKANTTKKPFIFSVKIFFNFDLASCSKDFKRKNFNFTSVDGMKTFISQAGDFKKMWDAYKESPVKDGDFCTRWWADNVLKTPNIQAIRKERKEKIKAAYPVEDHIVMYGKIIWPCEGEKMATNKSAYEYRQGIYDAIKVFTSIEDGASATTSATSRARGYMSMSMGMQRLGPDFATVYQKIAAAMLDNPEGECTFKMLAP